MRAFMGITHSSILFFFFKFKYILSDVLLLVTLLISVLLMCLSHPKSASKVLSMQIII